MLKTLVKKQLMEIFRSYFYNAKTNKKRSTAGIIAYIAALCRVDDRRDRRDVHGTFRFALCAA